MEEIEVRLTGPKENIFKAKKLIFKCGVTFYGGDSELGAEEGMLALQNNGRITVYGGDSEHEEGSHA